MKGFVKAYGENKHLQEIANVAIVAGNRDDIRDLEDTQQKILCDLLLDIDCYDLWGKVAIPKHISPDDVPDLYRLAAHRHGVFVNPAFTEPFGLTLLEAAASGLPIIAPDDGGPQDIIGNCHNGLLVNTLDSTAIAFAISAALTDKARWRQWSKKGVLGLNYHYSWEAHVAKYIKQAFQLLRRERKQLRRQRAFSLKDGKSPLPLVRRVLISDIDNTLIGSKEGLKALISWLYGHTGSVAFGIATGRPLESAIKILDKWGVPIPNVLITSVGSEIHYGSQLRPDQGWANHIRHLWRRDALMEALQELPGFELQAEENQREFKLSYNVSPDQMPTLKKLYQHLHERHLHAKFIYSHQQFLDVLPIRASKGLAIRYLAYKWGLPLRNFLVAGDSGNDKEMLVGDTRAVVVGNYSAELESLKGIEHVYFAKGRCASGIMEGLNYYGFDEVNSNKEKLNQLKEEQT